MTARHVADTPVGAALLPQARQVLAGWDAARAAVERAKAGQRATLVVGMSTSPGRGGLLPAIRSRFTDAHPQATVKLRQVGWEEPTAGLADGSSDLAFVWLPTPDADRCTWVVAEEPRLVALPQEHPPAARDVVDFADLLNEPFLALPQSAGAAAEVLARPGRPRRQATAHRGRDRRHGETYEALVDGRGVCLPASGNAPLITLGGGVARPVRGVSPNRLALAWRGDDDRLLALDYARACRQAAGSHRQGP